MKNRMFQLMDWAAAQALPAGPMAVLKELCRRSDMLGGCFPSQRRIAADTGMGERSVRRHIAFLNDMGLIERERRQFGYIRRSDFYRIKAPCLAGVYVAAPPQKPRKDYAKILYGVKKMAAAEVANLAGTYKKLPDEQKNNNYWFILGRKVFDGEAEDNPRWVNAGPIVLRRTAYKALAEIFRVSEAHLDEIIDRCAHWLSEQGESARRNWRGVLIAQLQRVS